MKKKLLLVPMTLATVVAPIVTTVACGNKEEKKIQGVAGENDKNKVVVTGVPDLSAYYKQVFTPETLKDRAIEEKDDTFWNGGLVYHAFSQTISILKGLAHEYGYDTKDATGQSPKEKFLAATGGRIISDSPADLTIDPSDPDDIKILKSVKFSGQTNPFTPTGQTSAGTQGTGKDDVRLLMPDFFGKGGFSKYHADGDFVAAIKYDGDKSLLEDKTMTDGNGDPMKKAIEDLYFNSFVVYNDPDTPGQLIAQIEDSSLDPADSSVYNLKALREIKLRGMSQVYPIIDNEKFVNDIVPAVQDAFSKVIQILDNVTTRGLLEGVAEVHVQLLFDEINFLKNIFFTTTTSIDEDDVTTTTYTTNPEFKSANFVEKLMKLNNGSSHWLALEALEKGFDYEFTSNVADDSTPNSIYEWVSEGTGNGGAMINGVKVGKEIIGLANADITDPMSLLPWTSFGQYIIESERYVGHETLGIDKNAFLAATPSYGFDEAGLQKSFDRLIK